MQTDSLIPLIAAKAAAHALNPALVCAVVEQESGWNPWAIRYEPIFFENYVERLAREGRLHDATEEVARAISWGLMQVMGEVAREAGYAGHLAQLCEPETGAEIGCRVLAKKLAETDGSVRQGLLLWNGGADLDYADQVLARVAKYERIAGSGAAEIPEASSAT